MTVLEVLSVLCKNMCSVEGIADLLLTAVDSDLVSESEAEYLARTSNCIGLRDWKYCNGIE